MIKTQPTSRRKKCKLHKSF